MIYFVAIMTAVVIAVLSYITLNKKISDKIRLFKPADPEEHFDSKELNGTKIWIIVSLLTVVCFISVLQIQARVNNFLGIAKMVIALICMAGAACYDFREKRIPNIFPGVMALSAVILLAAGVIFKQNGAVSYITSSVFAAASCAVFMVIAAFLTKQGIGAGDIKLISALALIGGVYVIIGTIFFGIFSCCICAIFALLLKKKTIHESLPFGPFLFIGFIIMLFVIQY